MPAIDQSHFHINKGMGIQTDSAAYRDNVKSDLVHKKSESTDSKSHWNLSLILAFLTF